MNNSIIQFIFIHIFFINIEIIDDLADHMDMTDQSLINRTRQVENINYKDSTCGYWIIIILLFISIVIVALLEV